MDFCPPAYGVAGVVTMPGIRMVAKAIRAWLDGCLREESLDLLTKLEDEMAIYRETEKRIDVISEKEGE
jgi:hypothetical protein